MKRECSQMLALSLPNVVRHSTGQVTSINCHCAAIVDNNTSVCMCKLSCLATTCKVVHADSLNDKSFIIMPCTCISGASSFCGSEDFTAVKDCVCAGYDTVYECTAVGNGFTQWSGSAFDCQGLGDEIFLSHNDFNHGVRKECNNGAIIGRTLRVNGSCYTSQLTVNTSASLNGTTIECTYDTGSILERIGSTTIMITSGSQIIACG